MKTTITVHLLFTHGHHIEILLEQGIGETKLFYSMNRWKTPRENWESDEQIISLNSKEKSCKAGRFKSLLARAEEYYCFTIEACPDNIIHDWKEYHASTNKIAFIFGHNCAVATQRFLEKYAQIPPPNGLSAPFQTHQLYYYLHWPSFFPAFALIPHKVFHNAKFHLETRNQKEIKETYKDIYWRMSINALLGFGSLTGIILASKYLSKTMNSFIAPVLGWIGINKSLLLFSDINLHAQKEILEEINNEKKL